MRLGWRTHVWGPFYLGGTIWQSRRKPRAKVYHGTYGKLQCPHNHRRPDTALACGQRMARAAR